MFTKDIPLPEVLPGEPAPPALSTAEVLLTLLGRLLAVGVLAVLTAPAWLLYGLLRLFLRRPPNVPSNARHGRALRLVLTEPGLLPSHRAALTLSLLLQIQISAVWGLAWMLDEILYGRDLRAVEIRAPLFEISAARSGSTQLAHYLEDDPHIVAPSLLQAFFPYLWLWKLARPTLGRWLDPDRVRARFLGMFPKAYIERHEMDPYRTDTFEMQYSAVVGLGLVMFMLSPRVMLEEFFPARTAPVNREVWDQDFVDWMDGIGRRCLLWAGAPRGERRLMVKGHFLGVADVLERRYPDARFLTVIRAPEKRIQSALNYNKSHPFDRVRGALPWAWIVAHTLTIEVAYCDAELAWFQREGGARRVVVRFDDYVKDLPGTLRRVYQQCLDLDDVPPQLTGTHATRDRHSYSINRSLPQLGVDVDALNARLADYIRWCKGR